MEQQILQNRWCALFSGSFNAHHNPTIVVEAFQSLVSKYSERHRFYHSINHIYSCLEHFDTVISLVNNQFAVEVAIWLHDIIYNPKSNKNEGECAKYAKNLLLFLDCDKNDIALIEKLINLTKHPSHPSTSDEKFLLDIDLSILGAKPEVFDKYEENVRKEYSFVPRFLFSRGRKKLLLSFVRQEWIFQTGHFRNNFEEQARQNLEDSIKKL